ncbi:PilZ domain-containing protein [Erythrobacter sp. SD-21]|uniref:PilZ domain-containing protein n=1 Tax=Erythrobacter sp. SD-21 TaxID=161528 RepID=UPI000A0375D0|nr:PilZ domain-containing protein [Erythrobacter sp. SD-21]
MDKLDISPELPRASRRSHGRTRMFITASLSSAATTGSVRVRDLSVAGALLESDDLPAVGMRVKLRRGDLSATGKIVRLDGKLAGVQFERLINPIDWLPNKAQSQLMVDTAFQTIKPLFEGGPPKESTRVNARAEARALPSSQTSRDELEGIADMLDALADQMSEDPAIIASYLDKLQVLDVASQKLRKVGRSLPIL